MPNRPTGGGLSTRWAADVDPDAPLPEYPRPEMQRHAGAVPEAPSWSSLNGRWSYAVTSRSASRPTRWDGEIVVPFAIESALSRVQRPLLPADRLWYRRTFMVPATWDAGRVLLHFGAVDWHCCVWCNGKAVGVHTGGFDPFVFDITEAIGAGDNELLVAVWDPTNKGHQPRGKQTLARRRVFYSAVSGIWQPVWIESVPRTHIAGLEIEQDTTMFRVTARVANAGAATPVSIALRRAGGGRPVAAAETVPGRPAQLDPARPRLWSPADPYLYEIEASVYGDSVSTCAGLRTFGIERGDRGRGRLTLNGEPIFHLAPLDQGYWPDGLYTAPTDAALRHDVEVTRELGFNATRKHLKVEPKRWYAHCDAVGLLVWQDMPNGGIAPFKRPAWRDVFVDELGAMVTGLRSTTCVAVWVPFNEGWGQWQTARVVERVRHLDPSRLVDAASGWWDKHLGDVASKHRYPRPAMRAAYDGRVEVCTEYGGIGCVVNGHTWPEKRPWSYRMARHASVTNLYTALLDEVDALAGDGLAGAVYTQLTDVEGEVNGLVTYDRESFKIDMNRIAQRNKTLIARRSGTSRGAGE